MTIRLALPELCSKMETRYIGLRQSRPPTMEKGPVMNHSRHLAVCIAFSLAALFPGTQALADVSQGALTTASCFSCHNAGGSNTPTLAGYPGDVLVAQMLAFKNDTRPGTIMNRLAKGYTDEQIAEMGANWPTN